MDVQGNWILAGLSQNELNEYSSAWREVPLQLGRRLDEAWQDEHHIYFPLSGIISQLVTLESGQTGEVAVIGREGVLGIPRLLSASFNSPLYADVQAGGSAIQINVCDAQKLFSSAGQFQQRVLQFAAALMMQFAHTAVCYRHHSVEQHFARWILLSLDRLEPPANEIVMTQEMIANMLGVRREGVNATARKFQSLGIMSYHRGRITVLDRASLTHYCCECYHNISSAYRNLL